MRASDDRQRFIRGNPIDSGREIGELLFDEVVERKRQDYFHNAGTPEAEFAALGDAGDVQFSGFEDVLAGCILTTGFPQCVGSSPGHRTRTFAVTTQAVRVSAEFRLGWDLFMCLFPSSGVKTIPISVRLAALPSWTPGEWDDTTGLSREGLLKWAEYLDRCSDRESQLRPRGGPCSQNLNQKRTTKSFVAHIEEPKIGLQNSFIRCCTGCRCGGAFWPPDRARPQKTRYPCADSTSSAATIY